MTRNKEFNSSEKEALNELRKRMKEEMNPELYEDVHLFYRFLAARDFNVDKAEAMLRKNLEWREKHDVKNIATFKKLEVMEKYIPVNFVGYDKEGCVVRYFPFGTMDFKGFHKSCKFEDEVKFVIHEAEEDTELLKKQSKKLGRNVDKCVYIANLKNFSFAQATDKRGILNLIYFANLYQDNYPERMKGAYVINASSNFLMLFTILKPFLVKKIVEKINIYSDDSWKEDLLKIIDADVLPAFLGGTKTDPDGNPLCNTFIKHGGRVPETYYLENKKKTLARDPGAKKVKLSRAALHKVQIDVKEPGSFLEWEFETKSRDIGFGVFHQKIVQGKEALFEIKAIQRIDTEEDPEAGTFKCENTGTYILIFDNTYSWLRTKEIFYKVKVVTPKENQVQME